MTEIYDVLIVGGGPTGLSATAHCAELGYSICWLDHKTTGGKSIFNDPGYFLTGMNRKVKELQENTDKYKIKIVSISGVQKMQLEPDTKVVTADNVDYHGKVVIQATTLPETKYGIPNEEEFIKKGNIITEVPKNFDGRGKHIVVLGDNTSAIRPALFFDKKGAKVDLFSCCKLDYFHPALKKRLNVSFVRVFENYIPKEFKLTNTKLEIIFDYLEQKISISDFDLIYCADHACANSTLLRTSGYQLNDIGRIVVINRVGITHYHGVFAVGNAQHPTITMGMIYRETQEIAREVRSYLVTLKEKHT